MKLPLLLTITLSVYLLIVDWPTSILPIAFGWFALFPLGCWIGGRN